ncbi:MAG: 3-isopropylmalate dehydratase small subunit, partial [Actinomycetota bacterium]
GFEVVIAPSLGDIFHTNCLKIGLVPIVLPEKDVERLMQAVAGGGSLTIDLEAQRVTGPDDLVVPFEFEPFARESLLRGLDDIALTLKREEQITDFERSHTARVDTSALPV